MNMAAIMSFVMMFVCIAAAFVIYRNSRRSPALRKMLKQQRYFKIYRFLNRFFLTENGIKGIANRLKNMSIMDTDDIQELSAKYYVNSRITTIGLALAGIVLFKDAASLLVCILVAAVVGTTTINHSIDRINRNVYRGMSKAMGAIRQEYLRTNSVAEAVGLAEVPITMRRPMNMIHQILTQNNGQLRLEEFYQQMPFRPLQTLAGVCYTINNDGDTVDESGISNFVQALDLMTDDVNNELERLVYQYNRFGKLEYLALLPVIGIPLVESYFSSTMPGTALIYNGPSGYLLRILTLVVALIAYMVVTRLNSTIGAKDDDRSLWVWNLLQKKPVARFVGNITPKNKPRAKLIVKLNEALSKQTVDEVYLKKAIFAVVCFVASLLIILSSLQLGRNFVLTSTQQLSLVATNEMDNFTAEQILELDNEYLVCNGVYQGDALKNSIKSHLPGLTDMQVQDQEKRLADKKASLDNCYFKWYYMLICLGLGALGWMLPTVIRIGRRMLVKNDAQTDFLQLQTLVSIIMNTDCDTLGCLQQMCQQSRIHKNILLYCYHSFPSDPMKELTRLKSKTPLDEFKEFINELMMTVSDLSLKEAFGDLILKREHNEKMRRQSMQMSIDKKRKWAGKVAMVSVAVFVIAEFLLPLLTLGIREFTNAMSLM